MFQKLLGLMVVAMVMVGVGCRSSGSSSSDSSSEQPTTQVASVPIPPDSPFAKIKTGMNVKEVYDTIGQPTDTNSFMTGKSFIPFHYGGDNARMVARYKGIGTITFSQNSSFTSDMSVISIDYDPTETGYQKN